MYEAKTLSGDIVSGHSMAWDGTGNKAYIRPAAEKNADGTVKVFDFVEVRPESVVRVLTKEAEHPRRRIHAETEMFRETARRIGAELHLDENRLIDDDHLDCIWYGGEIGYLEYKGWKLSVEVRGEVRLYGVDENGSPYANFTYVNKLGDGAVGSTMEQFFRNDLEYRKAVSNQDIVAEDGNWVEIFVQSPDGTWSDGFDVLDDNVLEAFNDIPAWVEWLETEFIRSAKEA